MEQPGARCRIKNAYLAFLQDKPYNKIKVSELIKAAGVNRSTFYRHFSDIFALYDEICDDVIEHILSDVRDDFSETQPKTFIFSLSDKVLRHSPTVRLISGKDGDTYFLFRLRNSLYDSYCSYIQERGLSDDVYPDVAKFVSDYVIILLSDAIRDEGSEYRLYREVDFTYDFDADPVDNVCEAMRILNGGNKNTQAAFFQSVIRLFSTGDSREKPVSELLSHSGYSRTEFYRFYAHKQDYFNQLRDALNLVAIRSIVPIIEQNDPHAFTVALDSWDRFSNNTERKALVQGLKNGYLLAFWTDVFLHINYAYRQDLEEQRGAAFDADERRSITFFTCSAACGLVNYLIQPDRETYLRNLELLYEFKKRTFGL